MSKVLCVGRTINGKLVIEKILYEEMYRKLKEAKHEGVMNG